MPPRFEWLESVGPAVAKPASADFGAFLSSLIQNALASALGGHMVPLHAKRVEIVAWPHQDHSRQPSPLARRGRNHIQFARAAGIPIARPATAAQTNTARLT